MSLYDVLGVGREATDRDIHSAFRKKSAKLHPDMPDGDEEKFKELNEAYQILKDPEARSRYDKTGRVDKDRITEEAVEGMIDQILGSVIEVGKEDLAWVDIRQKFLRSLRISRGELSNRILELKQNLVRAKKLKTRFIPKGEKDPVGRILQARAEEIEKNLTIQQDAMELNIRVEQVFITYSYEMGMDPEGQDEPTPTRRLRGPRFLTAGGITSAGG